MKHIVIPARFASTRLSGKPLLKIHGREMILRVVDQAKKVEAMRKAITADVDKKTGITTVTVTLQDPMVTAAITDTVVVKLQERYRLVL